MRQLAHKLRMKPATIGTPAGIQVFVPVRDCKDYLSEIAKFSMVDDAERNGKVLERVAFSVIHVCRSLLPGIANVPYLRPYQLDSCMERTRSTAVLDMYCYTRMSRPCSHQEAARGVHSLLGLAIGAPSEGAGGEGADGEGADVEEAAEQAVSEGEDDGQTVFE